MEAEISLSCQTNPGHAFPLTFIKMNFNIIPSSARAFSKWSPSFRFPHQNPVCIFPRYVKTGAGNHPAFSSICAGVLYRRSSGRIAQSVQRHATRWAISSTVPVGGEIFRTRPHWWRPTKPVQWLPGSIFQGWR